MATDTPYKDQRDESEKEASLHHEHAATVEEEGLAQGFDAVETAKVLRKVDLRLLPVLSWLYLLAFLDRSNLGNARIAGLEEELELSGGQFNMAATVFFLTYCTLEIPANIVLKILRPSRWMAFLVFSWGTVTICTGAVQSYEGLLVARIMLGVTEAGFFPAATYLVSSWYCRFEVQTRISYFYCAASLAGAFSGLLAFGISKMDGVANLGGWRWIYILEGILTVISGIAVLFLLPDSPETASWLSEKERRFLRYRLEQDSGTREGKVKTTEKFELKYLIRTLMDWKLWFTVCIYWGSTIPNYAFTFSAPTIILGLGYTSAQAQLLTIPIYVASLITLIICARLADKYRTRWKFIVFPYMFAIIGFVGLLSIPQERLPGLAYAFLFPVLMGCYPGVITVVSWVANNLAPSSKRACGVALSLMMANFGGAVGSNIFLTREIPRYWSGYGTCLGCLCLGIACTLFLRFMLKRENERRDQMTEAGIRAKYSEDELLDMGDDSPLYVRSMSEWGSQLGSEPACLPNCCWDPRSLPLIRNMLTAIPIVRYRYVY